MHACIAHASRPSRGGARAGPFGPGCWRCPESAVAVAVAVSVSGSGPYQEWPCLYGRLSESLSRPPVRVSFTPS